MKGSKKLDCYITLDWKKLAMGKHSNFLGPFVSYEEKSVVNMALLMLI
jgi:hypothetical protein